MDLKRSTHLSVAQANDRAGRVNMGYGLAERRFHVVHLSTVHNARDPRIRLKQLASIVEAGHRATLVTGDSSADRGMSGDGVSIEYVAPGRTPRWIRMLVTTPRSVFRAIRLKGDIYQIHDPELLPWALLLRLIHVPVIYDIHEDYVTAIRQKDYLPEYLRGWVARIVGSLERLLSAPFHRVIAERYYVRRFPNAVPVLNYPRSDLLDVPEAFRAGANRLLYTGSITEDRGAIAMAQAVKGEPDFELTLVGRCEKVLAEEVLGLGAQAGGNVKVPFVDSYVPFEEIKNVYSRGGWLGGLALFPDTPHYREKELTKFFEYMAVGVPIIASDFPVWRSLIEENGVGLCVNPNDVDAVRSAFRWLRDHPVEAAAMAKRGRSLVAETYCWERQAERLLMLYAELLST